jgi:RimJ/RimL family protein N-acetyltransferase
VPPPPAISLRPTQAADLPFLLALEQDPLALAQAGLRPRSPAAFAARWAEILADPAAAGVVPRVVLCAGAPVGAVNISPDDGRPSLGYWIARSHWGRGIATAAVGLLLAAVPQRPLYASAAAHNRASLRVLATHGFVVTGREHQPETARTLARETVRLVLSAGPTAGADGG